MKNGIIRTSIKIGVVASLEELVQKITFLRALGQYTIGFTSGTWDLLHEGHTRYLRDAASRVDLLIVGVDTDKWVKERNKGPNRPIVGQEERVELLQDYETVGAIVFISSFDQGPISFMDVLKSIRPDVLVISTSTPEIDEGYRKLYAEYCSELVNLERKSVITTTSRIRERMIEGKGELAKDLNVVTEKGFANIQKAVAEMSGEMQTLVASHLDVGGGE